jgi:hypothetical protein
VVESFGRVLVGYFTLSLAVAFRGCAMTSGCGLVKLRRRNMFIY